MWPGRPCGSEHGHRAQAAPRELAGQLVGQLSRDETRLFHGPATAAVEDRDARLISGSGATWIGVDQQPTDLAAGRDGAHGDWGEERRPVAPDMAGGQGWCVHAPLASALDCPP